VVRGRPDRHDAYGWGGDYQIIMGGFAMIYPKRVERVLYKSAFWLVCVNTGLAVWCFFRLLHNV
jgi:hypothetical protein